MKRFGEKCFSYEWYRHLAKKKCCAPTNSEEDFQRVYECNREVDMCNQEVDMYRYEDMMNLYRNRQGSQAKTGHSYEIGKVQEQSFDGNLNKKCFSDESHQRMAEDEFRAKTGHSYEIGKVREQFFDGTPGGFEEYIKTILIRVGEMNNEPWVSYYSDIFIFEEYYEYFDLSIFFEDEYLDMFVNLVFIRRDVSPLEISILPTDFIALKTFTIFPEYFIGASLIYMLIATPLINENTIKSMVQKTFSNCISLIILAVCYLIKNDDLIGLELLSFDSSLVNDYFAYITKIMVTLFSSIYFLINANLLKKQGLTNLEYLIIVLFAVLGLMLMCSSNDLLTAYLVIELSSLSFYILTTFKKRSSYSIESGLTYFITGAVSSALFLLGTSFIYGVTGTIVLTDLFLLSRHFFF